MKPKLLKTIGTLLLLLMASISNAQSPVLTFDGVNDYVNLGGLAGSNVRTIELWFSPTNDIDNSIASPQSLVVRETELDNSNDEFYLYFWTGNGRLQFSINPTIGATQTVVSNSSNWTAGQWYHVAAVIDPVDGMKMFIDGILQTSTNTYTTATANIVGSMTNDYTALGVWGEFQQRFFAGQMEDVRFSRTAMYDADFEPPCPDLTATGTTIGLWNLNTGSGTTAIDSGLSGFDGTIVGPTWGEATICDNCNCRAIITEESTSTVATDGYQIFNLNIDTQGELVTSICIELPYYISTVDPSCLDCDVATLTANGTILGGSAIGGTPGILDDPYGLGHARKICYNFATPTAVNITIALNLQFPAVLSACKNSVDYCLDVEIKKEDCTICEYEVCPKQNEQEQSPVHGGNDEMNSPFDEGVSFSKLDDLNVSIFPNPATSKVNVTIGDSEFNGGDIILTSIDGKVIQSQQTSLKSFEMDLTGVTPGTYVLIVQTGAKKVYKKLIIK